MHPACRRLERAASALLAIFLATILSGCALLGNSNTNPSFREYREYMAERAAVEVAEVEEEEQSFEEKLETARRFHRTGDVNQAMRLYFDAFRLNPDDPRAHEGIAYLQLADEPERAETVFQKIIEANPKSAMAHLGVGLAKLAQDDAEGAVPYLEQAIQLNPSSAEAHDSLAVALDRLERFPEAQVHARRARELAPGDAGIANNLGVSNLLAGNYDQAEKAFRNAISLNRRDPAYSNNLGIALGMQGRYEAALKAFREAGDEQVAESNLAHVYYQNGLLDDAITHYQLALEIGGEHDEQVLRQLNRVYDALAAME